MELITLIVHQEHLTLPDLVHLTADHGVHLVLVLLIERVMLKLQNLRGQCLTEVQDGTAAELSKLHFLTHFLANLIVGLDFLCISQGYLLVLVLHITIGHHDTVTVNLEVALVWVHNHIEVLVRAKQLSDNIAEAFLQHAHQCCTVNVLGLFKFLKGLDHRGAFHIFLSCHYFISFYYFSSFNLLTLT